jgi:uncharacterized protein
MLQLFVDGDACPVKEESYRVGARHGMPTLVVTCLSMRDPARAGVTLVIVPEGPDRADDHIAERIGPDDICVTDDIPLASRCIKQGALVVTARGRLLHEGNIGEALATRDLLERLRGDGTLSEGGSGGGPPPFTKRDRSRFLEQMEHAVRSILNKRDRQPEVP